MSSVATTQPYVAHRKNRMRSPAASDTAPQNGITSATQAMEAPSAMLKDSSLAPRSSTIQRGKKKESMATAKNVLARSYSAHARMVFIPPPAGWPEAGRCSNSVTIAAATASPAELHAAGGGEAQQVVGLTYGAHAVKEPLAPIRLELVPFHAEFLFQRVLKGRPVEQRLQEPPDAPKSVAF